MFSIKANVAERQESSTVDRREYITRKVDIILTIDVRGRLLNGCMHRHACLIFVQNLPAHYEEIAYVIELGYFNGHQFTQPVSLIETLELP
jgi:hypothetical protein